MARQSDSPSHDWERLVALTVLGTDRAGGTMPELRASPAILASLPADWSIERKLLVTAAALSVYVKAGNASATQAIPKPTDGARKDIPACTPRAGRCLARILSGEYGMLLNEWCEAAAKAGVRAPDELLPPLLDRLTPMRGPERDAVAKVLGERGAWLAGHNPRWNSLIARVEDAEVLWQTGTREERSEAFRSLRESDPAAARSLLESTWAQEDPDDRAAFVAAFRTGLSLADEPFLESALDDSRKPVRTAAAELLACLPESAWCGRMKERVLRLMQFTPGRKGLLRTKAAALAVELPKACDKVMARDGIETRARGKMGQGAFLLYQMVAGTPLDTWSTAWQTTPAEVIAAAVGSEFSDALVQGLACAAARQGRNEWAEAVLRCPYFMEAEEKKLVDGRAWCLRGLTRCLNPSTREDIVQKVLQKGPFPFHEHPALDLVRACEGLWSPVLSRSVVVVLRKHFQHHSTGYDFNLVDTVSREFSPRMHVSLAEEVVDGWPSGTPLWTRRHEEMVSNLGATLRFRRDYLEDLTP